MFLKVKLVRERHLYSSFCKLIFQTLLKIIYANLYRKKCFVCTLSSCIILLYQVCLSFHYHFWCITHLLVQVVGFRFIFSNFSPFPTSLNYDHGKVTEYPIGAGLEPRGLTSLHVSPRSDSHVRLELLNFYSSVLSANFDT